jgi:hypothetical protein
MLITTSVYIGSSIYSPAIVDGAEYFGVSEIVSVLGLSLFGESVDSCSIHWRSPRMQRGRRRKS